MKIYAVLIDVGIAAAAVAALLALGLSVLEVQGAPHLLLLVGIAVAIALGGRAAMMAGLCVSVPLLWFVFSAPPWSLAIPKWRDELTVVVFVAAAALIWWLLDRGKREIDDLMDANAALRAAPKPRANVSNGNSRLGLWPE